MRLLDLFCGAGGAARGYADAGFEVTGIDRSNQPEYPYKFIRADALEYAAKHGKEFDLIHASPPCQCFTKYGNRRPNLSNKYEDLVRQTRSALTATGLPYVIENVVGSPLITPVILCGSMFGLDIRRHRLFESNLPLSAPACDHHVWAPNRFPGGRSKERGNARVLCRGTIEIGRWNIPLAIQQKGMGIDWIRDIRMLSEAVPPAYTEFIGKQLLRLIQAA